MSRGVALARMDSREACETIIARLNCCVLPGCLEPMRVKFANGPTPRRSKPGSQRGSGFFQSEGSSSSSSSYGSEYGMVFDDHFDDPLVPSMPGTPSQMRHPASVLSSPGTAGSRLSAWVASPREDSSMHVPVVPRDRIPSARQGQYELEFASDGSYQSVQHIFDEFE